NGVVNARIVAPATIVPQAEGEAPATPVSQVTTKSHVLSPVVVAEGEAPAVAVTANTIRATTSRAVLPVATTGAGSTDLDLSSATSERANEILAPSVTTLATPFSLVTKSTDDAEAAASKPDAAGSDATWSQAIVTPLEFYGATSVAKVESELPTSEVEEELLAVDEAFAATDSW
ncbi:MAG: hypothetical protein ABI614_11230, partial [Planctomycetota bacterium]